MRQGIVVDMSRKPSVVNAAVEAWQIAAIEEGIAAADAGDMIPHERIREWLLSWGTEDENEPPV